MTTTVRLLPAPHWRGAGAIVSAVRTSAPPSSGGTTAGHSPRLRGECLGPQGRGQGGADVRGLPHAASYSATWKLSTKPFTASARASPSGSLPVVSMPSRIAPCRLRMYARSSSSKRRTCDTGTLSM